MLYRNGKITKRYAKYNNGLGLDIALYNIYTYILDETRIDLVILHMRGEFVLSRYDVQNSIDDMLIWLG